MLAKNVRKGLIKKKIYRRIRCVFSTELTDKTKIEQTDGKGYKKSIVGTISYMPNLFGIYCSYEVIRKLIENKKGQQADPN
jgi:tRNA A37 threonylcarbamoyladenosine dehydratase